MVYSLSLYIWYSSVFLSLSVVYLYLLIGDAIKKYLDICRFDVMSHHFELGWNTTLSYLSYDQRLSMNERKNIRQVFGCWLLLLLRLWMVALLLLLLLYFTLHTLLHITINVHKHASSSYVYRIYTHAILVLFICCCCFRLMNMLQNREINICSLNNFKAVHFRDLKMMEKKIHDNYLSKCRDIT